MTAPSLAELISPPSTALLTMECQRGVVGDLAKLPHLADAAAEVGSLEVIGKLCEKARQVGAPVVHCIAENHLGGVGAARNCRLLSAGQGWLIKGDPSVELVPELNYQETDLTIPRAHGVTPFTATSLDQVLRNMGVTTVIATGHSVNVGLMGLVLSAVDLGYQVVIAEDAIASVPVKYAQEVLKNTFFYLATICKSGDILESW